MMRFELRIPNSEVKDSGKLRDGSSLTPDFSLGVLTGPGHFRKVLIITLLTILPVFLSAQPEPATSRSQVAPWESMKYGMFIHFNMNTYARAEYDNGKMPAEGFNPEQLDVDQWIRTAKEAGMKYAVLTAKHTGGFCLWDDHNQPISTKDEYFQLTKDHITELVSNYDGLAEIWIDIPGVLKPAQRAEFQVFNTDQVDDPDYLNSFQTGREYFFLRSGKAGMIIQADKSGMGPAFTYMLFDAENPGQSANKVNALNYIPGTNFSQTALKVILGTVEFSALGHNSEAKWVTRNNNPAVELGWWAGGIRVDETFATAGKPGTFTRTILLTNADLAGDDTIRIAGLDGYPDSDPIPIKKGQSITLEREVQSPSTLTTLTTTTTTITTPTTDHPILLQSPLSTITTSDSLIFSLYRNASFSLPGMVAANGRMDAGVFEYGNQWVRDGSNVAMGLIYSGSFESAKGLLTYILSDLVSDEGTTVIAGGFDEPDREEFDQMGVLMDCLKLYYQWTGDDSLLTTYRKRILALIERPLNPVFRDSTGMVHNKREFWERTFSDAYELAYQTYMIQGLRDAADLSGILGVPEKADFWRQQADVFLNAMLHHPTRSLVDQGALIKRRNVNGEIADITLGRQTSYKNDAPGPTEYNHRLNPDATYALPIFLGIIDPHSDLARKSLDKLESIWNARWDMGGYERYHSSSQIDQPGPWSCGTAFIARAQHDAGFLDRSRRSLQWLYDIQGGNAGAWFEEIPLNRGQIPWCGIVPWTSAEVTSFVVRHWLGVKVSGDYLIITPNLYPGTKTVSADLRFRAGRLKIEIDQLGRKPVVTVNGKPITGNRSGEYKMLISK